MIPLIMKKLGAIQEHRFHPVRKWRFDYAFPEIKLAIEINGGAFINGRHNRSTGAINDWLKLNAAQRLGWCVLQYTPSNFDYTEVLQIIEERKSRENVE